MRQVLRALLLAGILVGTFCGCSRYYWSKSGSTAEEFHRDSRECVREARSAIPGPISGLAVAVIEQRYRACLATRGYVRDKQVDPPVPGSYRGLENEEEFAAAAAP